MKYTFLKAVFAGVTEAGKKVMLEEMGIDHHLVQGIYDWASEIATYGKTANYIPELSNVDTSKKAIAIGDLVGNIVEVGTGVEVVVTLQSVVKPFLYVYALQQGIAPNTLSGIEATSLSFNSDRILDPDMKNSKPGHPLNNAGAISCAGAIANFSEFLDFMKLISSNSEITVLDNVFRSEMETNHNNRAISYRLVASGRFHSQAEGEKALENYTLACSIGMTVKDTLNASLFLAGGGRIDGRRICGQDHIVRALNAMNSFGLYEYTGELTLLAAGARALTSKSGVSGLVINLDPGRGASCSYSPLLDEAGNSVFGKYALIPLNNVLSAPEAMRLSVDEIIAAIEAISTKEQYRR